MSDEGKRGGLRGWGVDGAVQRYQRRCSRLRLARWTQADVSTAYRLCVTLKATHFRVRASAQCGPGLKAYAPL